MFRVCCEPKLRPPPQLWNLHKHAKFPTTAKWKFQERPNLTCVRIVRTCVGTHLLHSAQNCCCNFVVAKQLHSARKSPACPLSSKRKESPATGFPGRLRLFEAKRLRNIIRFYSQLFSRRLRSQFAPITTNFEYVHCITQTCKNSNEMEFLEQPKKVIAHAAPYRGCASPNTAGNTFSPPAV